MEGPRGEGKSTAESGRRASSARFRFSGVAVPSAGRALGVRSVSGASRLLGRLEGVCGAFLLDRMPLSLLYSLYFWATRDQLPSAALQSNAYI